MGDRIPVKELEQRARKFFEEVVIPTLVERNTVRGDSYLDMDLEDYATMFRDKGGRIRTVGILLRGVEEGRETIGDDRLKEVMKELRDGIVDEAGYAALAWIWMQEQRSSPEGE